MEVVQLVALLVEVEGSVLEVKVEAVVLVALLVEVEVILLALCNKKYTTFNIIMYRKE